MESMPSISIPLKEKEIPSIDIEWFKIGLGLEKEFAHRGEISKVALSVLNVVVSCVITRTTLS